MNYKYETISQRENIKEEDVARILDYLERHAKHFDYSRNRHRIELVIDKRFSFYIWNIEKMYAVRKVAICDVDVSDPENPNFWDDYLTLDMQFAAQTIPQIYSYIKARWSK